MAPSRNPCRFVLSTCLCVFLGSAGGAEPGGDQDAAGAGRAALGRRYVEIARRLEVEVLAPDRSPLDPMALVLREGVDAERLRAFVREKIAYEPYAGAVRGAAGTLASGAGGDWDRALLLRAALERAGYRTRLRAVERSAEERERVLEAFLARSGPSPTVALLADPAAPPPSPDPELLAELGISEGARTLLRAQAAVAARRAAGASYDFAAVESPRIEAALRSAGQVLGDSWAAWRSRLLSAVAERVAVEIASPSGEPRFFELGPDPEPLPEARWREAPAFEVVPPEKTGRLSLEVAIATGRGGAKRQTLLTWSAPLADLTGTPLTLEIVPVDEKRAREIPGLWDDRTWRDAVASFRQFQAVLRAGDAWAGSQVFDLDGNVREVTPEGRIASARRIGGAVSRGLGGLFGGGKKESEKKGPGLEELVLEVELDLPGSPPRRQARLLWGKTRKEVSPVASVRFLVLPSPPVPGVFSWLALKTLCRNAPHVEKLAQGEDPAQLRGLGKVDSIPAALVSWQGLRMALAGLLLEKHQELAYVPGPSVVADTVQLSAGQGAEPVRARRALDILFELGRFHPRTPEAVEQAARANLFLGVAMTALESIVLGGAEPGELPSGPCVEAEIARLSGAAPAARKAGDSGAGPAKLSPLALWTIARNEEGSALVFPRPDRPAAWWSVDPQSGLAIGRGLTGEGQSAIEYLKITQMNLNHLQCWLKFQKSVMFGGGSRLGAHYDYLACVTGADDPFTYAGGYFGTTALDDPGDFFKNLDLANDGAKALVGIIQVLAGD